MLDITKIKNNMVKPCKEELDLSILLSAIVMTIKIILRIRGINDNRFLNNETDKKHYMINVDSQRITQVVTNLLNNAVKLTEDDKGGGVDI